MVKSIKKEKNVCIFKVYIYFLSIFIFLKYAIFTVERFEMLFLYFENSLLAFCEAFT